jgi:hypothetical protein
MVMEKVSLEYINTRKERMVVIAEYFEWAAVHDCYRVRSKQGSNETVATWRLTKDGELIHVTKSIKTGTYRKMYVGQTMRTVSVDESVPMTLPQRVAYSDQDKTVVR